MLGKKKIMFEVQYHEFEDLVKQVYGQQFEFPVDEESGNAVSYTYNIRDDKTHSKWDLERLEKFKETGQYQYLSRTLLDDLCQMGKIEPGEYLIKVSW